MKKLLKFAAFCIAPLLLKDQKQPDAPPAGTGE